MYLKLGRKIVIIVLGSLIYLSLNSQNKPEQEKWLQDAGFGMFIHWNLDVQLGTVISHTLVGASEDYVNRYFTELPQTFDPEDYDADRYAKLAKLSGMKYMVLTTKHHSGFCMWPTNTTDFNISSTPYGKDIVKQYTDACRKYGLKVGLYFSPEDFLFLHENGELIRRTDIEKISHELKEKYIDYVKKQCTELLTNYGTIDIMFFDGGENILIDALKSHCRKINPDLLITRGEIPTPEQYLPGVGSDRVWESCMTMGTQWAFKPTNEEYKTGGQIIKILTETRAKGGALLLNVGPDPYGVLPFEQERNLREVAAWYFINHEAVDGVRPWVITNEENIWFTKEYGKNTVFAILFHDDLWERGARREFLLHSVKATYNTKISVLGQNDKIVEYQKGVDATSRFKQMNEGLEISVVRAQRIYNNHKWPNPIVVKLENVEPALIPPRIITLDDFAIDNQEVTLNLELKDLGDAEKVQLAFQYRITPESLNVVGEIENWTETKFIEVREPGVYSIKLRGIGPENYQYRAMVKHPKITITGEIHQFMNR
jgi:alpha-L-fucosidase